MGFIYFILHKFFKSIISLYFRKIYTVGLENVPEEGPVIICCNHSNQFIDAFLIGSILKQELSYTIAASSFSKPVIGKLAEAVKAIPVKRPEDSKKKAEGRISFIDLKLLEIGNDNKDENQSFPQIKKTILIKGKKTKFTEVENTMGKGWSVLITNLIFPVKKIIDDETIEVGVIEGMEAVKENEEYEFFVSKYF